MRVLLNAVPVTVIMVITVAVTVGAVVLAVWLTRRIVPATRDGSTAGTAPRERPVVRTAGSSWHLRSRRSPLAVR